MLIRRWGLVLGAAGFLLGHAWPRQEPDQHWIARNGVDWRGMGNGARTAYVEGFLAGSALGQAVESATDSAGLHEAIARLRRTGGFRFPFGPNVYASRMSDYYWWENHRSLPTWYALWEVNSILIGPTEDSAR